MLQQIDGKITALEAELTELRRRKLAFLQSELTALQASMTTGDEFANRPRPRGRPSREWLAGRVNVLPAASPGKRRGPKPGKRRAGR